MKLFRILSLTSDTLEVRSWEMKKKFIFQFAPGHQCTILTIYLAVKPEKSISPFYPIAWKQSFEMGPYQSKEHDKAN